MLANREGVGGRLSRPEVLDLLGEGRDLSGADLSGISLVGLDLSGAPLRGADLTDADLSHSDLSGAGRRGAKVCLLYTPGAAGGGTR